MEIWYLFLMFNGSWIASSGHYYNYTSCHDASSKYTMQGTSEKCSKKKYLMHPTQKDK